MKKYITVDSFGAHCPENWEEIAYFLNRLIDEHEPEENERDENDWYDNLWEKYWKGDINGSPEPVE